MWHSLKERKRMERSERERTQCPTLQQYSHIMKKEGAFKGVYPQSFVVQVYEIT